MAAGDVLLFHRPTNIESFLENPMGTVMTALIHLTTRSRWNHAAILVDDNTYAEATDQGVRLTKLGTSTDQVWQIPVEYTDDDDRFAACNWAMARVGTRYGYWQAFMCGFNAVFQGLGIVIKKTDAVICSELVAESLWRAGHTAIRKDPALVSPGDLAKAFGVRV